MGKKLLKKCILRRYATEGRSPVLGINAAKLLIYRAKALLIRRKEERTSLRSSAKEKNKLINLLINTPVCLEHSDYLGGTIGILPMRLDVNKG